MDKPTLIDYHDRKVNLDQLKRVAGQGCTIDVVPSQLNVIHSDDNADLVVVAVGAPNSNRPMTYDVLSGTPKDGKQKAKLISKIILKKAYLQPPQPPIAHRLEDDRIVPYYQRQRDDDRRYERSGPPGGGYNRERRY